MTETNSNSGLAHRSNREIAKAACNQLYYDLKGLEFGGDPMAHEDNLSVIEQVLDAKDKERADAVKEAHARGAEEGFLEGQKEMRERAAKAIEYNTDGLVAPEYDTVSDVVRSLPLSEQTSNVKERNAEQKDERK